MRVNAYCLGTPVGKSLCRVVAAGAGGRAICRQDGVKEQVAPKIDLLRSETLAQWRQAGFKAANPRIAERPVLSIATAQNAAAVNELEGGGAGVG